MKAVAMHRDYLVSAPIRIFAFANRIEIVSPGHLSNNLTVENIRAGNSNLRSPILASYVAKGLLPYRGLGSGVPRALESWPDIDFRRRPGRMPVRGDGAEERGGRSRGSVGSQRYSRRKLREDVGENVGEKSRRLQPGSRSDYRRSGAAGRRHCAVYRRKSPKAPAAGAPAPYWAGQGRALGGAQRAGPAKRPGPQRPDMLKWIEKMLVRVRRKAPRQTLEPPSIGAGNAAHGLETSNRALAQPAAGNEDPHPPRPDSAERSREHGVRGRTGGPGGDESGTLAPRYVTRYVETRLGILSYTELAPHLARNVLALERRIEDGEFAQASLDDTLRLQFHRLICGDLVPQLAGWRRTNVTAGEHEPPDFFRVPTPVREYGRNLQARLSANAEINELLLETLAFAEGRLPFIHPFADFNGCVTRVWLREILRRLDLPPVRLAPTAVPASAEYLTAFRAADRNGWRMLIEVWRERFEEGDAK